MTEEEYKKLWLEGKEQTEYNLFRFSEPSIREIEAINWLKNKGVDINSNDLKGIIGNAKIYDKNPLKTQLSDKIAAREYLTNLGLEHLLVPTYKSEYRKITTNDLDVPSDVYGNCNYFYVKTNHGSGWNTKFYKGGNKQFTIDKVNEWLSLNYAYVAGYEWQYEGIKPGFLIQPSLYNGNIVDWMFYCVDGEIVCLNLHKKSSKNVIQNLANVDSNGKATPYFIGAKPEMKDLPSNFIKILDEMKPIVKELCKPFKFVRIDFFYVNRIYFAEFTFSPCSGVIDLMYR